MLNQVVTGIADPFICHRMFLMLPYNTYYKNRIHVPNSIYQSRYTYVVLWCESMRKHGLYACMCTHKCIPIKAKQKFYILTLPGNKGTILYDVLESN